MVKRLALVALMLGNFVIGTAILLPPGMLHELSAGLGVSIPHAGLLVTYGAVVLCIGSPLMAWWTSWIERRALLAGTLIVIAVGHAASAVAPSYGVLLALRLAMLAIAAIYTPQAASTVGLIVSESERASAIAFVFLGWSLSVAAGLPLVAFMAAHVSWRVTYGAVAMAAVLAFVLLLAAVPSRLHGAAVSRESWGAIARHRPILLLLTLTSVQVSGQFVLFTYLAPLLSRLANAGVATVEAFFAVFGVAGFVGNVIATEIVRSLGPFRTSWIFLLSLLLGVVLWTIGAGSLYQMAGAIAFLGFGFAAMNSMQQARLVGAAPDLASAAVALNTSSIYVGQAIGSGLGGFLLAHDHPLALGYAAIAFLLSSVGLLAMTKPKSK